MIKARLNAMFLWPLCEGTARWYWFPCAWKRYDDDDDNDVNIENDDNEDENDDNADIAHTWKEWRLYSWSSGPAKTGLWTPSSEDPADKKINVMILMQKILRIRRRNVKHDIDQSLCKKRKKKC